MTFYTLSAGCFSVCHLDPATRQHPLLKDCVRKSSRFPDENKIGKKKQHRRLFFNTYDCLSSAGLYSTGTVLTTTMHVRLKAIGAVPQVSPSVVDFPREAPFAAVPELVRDRLRLKNSQQLWCYVGNAFIPSMDDTLDTIVGLTGTSSSEDMLVVTYSLVEAFG